HRVLANSFRCERLGRGFEHRQLARFRLDRLPRFAAALPTLIVAQGARTGVAQERKAVMGLMAVLPFDIDSLAGTQMDLDGFRIGHRASVSQKRSTPHGAFRRAAVTRDGDVLRSPYVRRPLLR